jgi:hypothetical protein
MVMSISYHEAGETLFLSALFSTTQASVPPIYYVGLDNRSTLSYSDTLLSLVGEPPNNVFGYTRQPLTSTNGFNVTFNGSHMQASSGIITFNAIGGSIGPVGNVFLATSPDNTGDLIISMSLSSVQTITSGQKLTIRLILPFTTC